MNALLRTRAAVMTVALTAVALAAGPVAARAQSIDFKGGLAYGAVPNNSGILPGTLSANTGFALGIGVATGGVVGWGAEFLYAQRGFKGSVLGTSQKLSYLDIPLYLRVSVPSPGITPFAYAGPQFSLEINCDADGGACPSGHPSLTYAGVIGAGARFGMLGGLSLEARYVYGLSDLQLSTVSSSQNYQTRSFLILLGFGL